MRSNAARAWVLVVASTLLLAACGQAPAPTSSAPTAASSSQPTAASSNQPTAASESAPTAASSTGAASGDAIPIGIACSIFITNLIRGLGAVAHDAVHGTCSQSKTLSYLLALVCWFFWRAAKRDTAEPEPGKSRT